MAPSTVASVVASEQLERQLSALEPWMPGLASRLREQWQDHGDPAPMPEVEYLTESKWLEAWLAEPSGSAIFCDPQLLQLLTCNVSQLEPTGCSNLEELNLECVHDLAADLQYDWVISEAARFALERGWPCETKPRFSPPRGLMIHGIGSGRYLARILERSQADVVLLFESDLDRLLAALTQVDLASLIAPFSGPGRAFFVLTSQDPDQVFEEATALLTQSNLFVLDALLVCDCARTEATAALQERFGAARNNMLIGYLGFFTDELHMLMNGEVNFRHLGAAVLAPAVVASHPSHAVIAASGPSLKQQLPRLAAERKRYTLFSGWSTLGTLLEAGIVPDYHCPMERHAVHDALKQELVAAHLGAITLVGPASLDPRQLAPYADRLLVFRSASAISAMYAESPLQLLDGEGPLTVNMAAIAAVLLGFRHLHFFGADFGAADQADTRMENALLDTPYKFNLSEEGVGGVTIHTDLTMLDARRALERLLAGCFTQGEPVMGHNFSAGLTIAGAPEAEGCRFSALLGGSVRQPHAPLSLPYQGAAWAEQSWRLSRVRQRCLACLQSIRQLVEPIFEPATLLAITDLANLYQKPLSDQLPARLYRGTVFRTWFSLLMLHRRLRFPDAEAEALWLDHCRGLLHRMLDSLEALSFEAFDYLEDLPSVEAFNFRSRLRPID